MNWPYIHLTINHFPIMLTVLGSAVLLLAFVLNRRALWLYALATLTLAGASAYPVFYTGDAAAHALRGTDYVERSMVEEHDDAAGWALGALLLMGVGSAYSWRRLLRRDLATVPPLWLRSVVALLALFGLSVVVRTAYLGGKIIHESPKLLAPASGK